MEPMISFLQNVKIARKQVHNNLTVFPLLAPYGADPDYLTLEQVLNQNLIQITELDNEESVPELKLLNRGEKVLLDHDLAELYDVETKQLKRAVRRHVNRFPEDFMFQLSNEEFQNLRSHFGTSSWGGTRYGDS